ncbi:CDP-glycerol glycerophosphotransferase family protein [Streptomyces sp. HPF1205]|uniref:bifunctional glycosyltransferase/CDP-glycerol:glycerophosphate glycerophosphotransferase n=1 Tax=Streptomyces sp. HPF1205 TaxID=2873262 RepID=UPI001CED5B90|nr:CDP-glycerol glycerophosphotransferase family protein [Streptomyces sp. HPF1205]
MPRFSVVVPAHRAQGFLRACLDSVLAQSFGDVEVVVVDDASPDACGLIAEEFAAADPRVRPLRLDRHGGAGPARDAGAARASGDYLLFLDADDLLAPGALAAADARLTRTGDPDVLLVDHERFTVRGDAESGGDRDALAEAGGVVTASAHPGLLTVHPAIWNRLVRRDFWTGHAFRFGDAPYEDLAVANRVLLTAGRVACLARVCVRRRVRRAGSLSTTPGRRHLAVLDRYESLFPQVPGDGPRAALYAQMGAVLAAVGGPRGPLGAAGRREFVRRAGPLLTRYRPAGRPWPEGDRGRWLRGAATGSYARHRARLTAAAWRAAAASRARAGRRALARVALRGYYRLRRLARLDPCLVVYAAYWNRGVACNPAAIERKARELAPRLRAVWVVNRADRDRLPPGTAHVVAGSRRYWAAMARATYLVNNAGFPGAVVKRPGQVYLQTHHGTPLKHMGMDLLDRPAAACAMDFARLLEHADQWDYSLAANQHSAETWERVYPSDHLTLPAGYPRNDVFYEAGAGDVRRARECLGLAPDTLAILYAPTHRDYLRRFTLPLDLDALSRALGPGHTLLVRAHYFYDGVPGLPGVPDALDAPQDPHARAAVVDVSHHPSVEALCLASDALLCDFSSLMFDYANLDRPIVVHGADWEAYRAARGVYFDLLSGRPGETPGVVARDEAAIAEAFRGGAWRGPEAAALRAAFRARFCAYDDGLAAERVVRRVFLGETELLPYRELDERRPAPAGGPKAAATAPAGR